MADTTEHQRAGPQLPPLIRLTRPRQWAKNVLVFAAPFAAGTTQPVPLIRTLVMFGAFCAAASGSYCLNDALDVESDRAHPDKRLRPVAAGAVGVPTAVVLAVVLLGGALAAAAALGAAALVIVGAYVGLTVTYSLKLKHLAVIDLAAVAGGFILRSVAGGAAAPVDISQWFLIVAGFGSLFIVAGKRQAEHADLGVDAGSVRATLGEYSAGFLLFVRSLAAAVCVAGYCLWAFESAARGGELWFQLSIIPFVIGILLYGLRLEQGAGAAPEDILLGDRTLQLVGLAWIALYAIGVHGP